MLSGYSSHYRWILVIMIMLTVLAGACTQSIPMTSSPSTPASPGTALVEAGSGVYSNWCARCHGQDGQGLLAPALIGSNAALGKYDTARGLYDATEQEYAPE